MDESAAAMECAVGAEVVVGWRSGELGHGAVGVGDVTACGTCVKALEEAGSMPKSM